MDPGSGSSKAWADWSRHGICVQAKPTILLLTISVPLNVTHSTLTPVFPLLQSTVCILKRAIFLLKCLIIVQNKTKLVCFKKNVFLTSGYISTFLLRHLHKYRCSHILHSTALLVNVSVHFSDSILPTAKVNHGTMLLHVLWLKFF